MFKFCIKGAMPPCAHARQTKKIGPIFSSFAGGSTYSEFIAWNLDHPRIFFAIKGFLIYNSLSAFILVGFCSVDPIITV